MTETPNDRRPDEDDAAPARAEDGAHVAPAPDTDDDAAEAAQDATTDAETDERRAGDD